MSPSFLLVSEVMQFTKKVSPSANFADLHYEHHRPLRARKVFPRAKGGCIHDDWCHASNENHDRFLFHRPFLIRYFAFWAENRWTDGISFWDYLRTFSELSASSSAQPMTLSFCFPTLQ